jgi:hypothetical protein
VITRKDVNRANPIYSKGLFHKLVDGSLEILGKGTVELCVDSHGNHRYYLDGLLHNPVGPALITSNGYKEWYIHGKQIHPAWLETRKQELGLKGSDHKLTGLEN